MFPTSSEITEIWPVRARRGRSSLMSPPARNLFRAYPLTYPAQMLLAKALFKLQSRAAAGTLPGSENPSAPETEDPCILHWATGWWDAANSLHARVVHTAPLQVGRADSRGQGRLLATRGGLCGGNVQGPRTTCTRIHALIVVKVQGRAPPPPIVPPLTDSDAEAAPEEEQQKEKLVRACAHLNTESPHHTFVTLIFRRVR